MAAYSYGPASPEVIPFLAANVRESDRREIQAVVGLSPMQALSASLNDSERAWTGYLNGEPCCMFGVGPAEGDPKIGVVWMIGTDAIDRHPLAFLKGSRVAFREMLTMFPTLINAVDARHAKALRWLRWLGAEIGEAQPYGVEGLPFHFFRVRRG